MPKLSEVLTRARRAVAGGWAEPMSLTAAGHICAIEDEGITRYCVHDALELGAQFDPDLQGEAWEAVARQLALRVQRHDLGTWLSEAGRTHHEVLSLLAHTEAHAHAEESRP